VCVKVHVMERVMRGSCLCVNVGVQFIIIDMLCCVTGLRRSDGVV
jgi:hypothetical protein